MATGWPFWAATSDERIETAFDLARLARGEHLVDLGCGDGRVLVRAADRGARVTGIEIDADLAAKARALLGEYGFTGDVIEGDITEALVALAAADPPAVVFAYLSPATLQRLSATLARLADDTRIVVTGWPVPGWDFEAAAERCFLYRVPPKRSAAGLGAGHRWESEGLIVAVPADAPSLVATRFRHPGGPVRVGIDGDLERVVDALAGTEVADVGEVVVCDLRWRATPSGTVAEGSVMVDGLPPFDVLGMVGDGPSGMWGVTREGMTHLRQLLAQRGPDAVLAAARASET